MFSFRSTLVGSFLASIVTPLAAITIAQFNVSYHEDFDTLAIVTSGTLPAGWEIAESGSSANTTYGAGTGSSSTGNTYSFGAASSTERALGALRTSGVASTFGTVVANGTGGIVTQITIQFTGEQWRLGALSRADRLDFSYSLDGTSITTGSWLDADALDFTAGVTSGTLGALDGDAAENRMLISHTVTGLSLLDGSSLWLRWVDFDATGSDDGLAIDNFSILAPQSITGGDGTENVPDTLPMSAIVATFGALMIMASRGRRSLDVA